MGGAVAEDVGTQLRRRREGLGLTLEQVSEGTGVPRDYLEALETGERRQLPPGPYATAYARTYRSFLKRVARRMEDEPGNTPPLTVEPATTGKMFPSKSVPTPEGEDGPSMAQPVVRKRPVPQREVSEDGDRRPRLPLPLVRAIAATASLLFCCLIVWQGYVEIQRVRMADAAPSAHTIEVKVQLQRNARLTVWVDGRKRADRLFEGNELVSFVAKERVDIDVPGIEKVRLWLGERRISPLGRKGRPRRISFIADAGGQG